jgi:hypothetical protein
MVNISYHYCLSIHLIVFHLRYDCPRREKRFIVLS